MHSRKTAADYAAIAVAPILIFLMISSLANFLILVLYRGGFQSRLSWTVMCFTMGIVAVARIAIERDRVYSYGYAAALGLATLLVMSRLVDSLLFCIFILFVVGYLADLIVRDCTLIDDDVDASGEGLIDSGHLFLKKQIEISAFEEHRAEKQAGEPEGKVTKPRGRVSQPGRTVMYLAMAALPLFGLGQFFLRNDSASWASAKYLLAFYLFASLSLLVTTSFVGLRRYLRQRKVDMPTDVSVAWLSAGVALIAVVLLLAYFAPMPGRALASFEFPTPFDSPGNTSSSRYGWGEEGADRANSESSGTAEDPQGQGKEQQGYVDRKGGQPGGSGDGERKDGPAGSRKGGDKSEGKQNPQAKAGSEQKSNQQDKGERGSKGQSQAKQKSQGNGAKSGTDQSESGKSESGKSESGKSESGKSESSQSDSGSSESGQAESEEPESGAGASSDRETQETDSTEAGDSGQSQDQDSASKESGKNSSQRQPSSSESQSGITQTASKAISAIGSMLKYLIILILLAIVGIFLYRNWSLICQWFSDLFAVQRKPPEDIEQSESQSGPGKPRRSFSSFRNPIGNETDLRRVVIVTFQAFESWSFECGVIRGKEETPAEFTRRVSKSLPDSFSDQLPKYASQVVESYNRIVFGKGNATKSDITAAARVWDIMNSRS